MLKNKVEIVNQEVIKTVKGYTFAIELDINGERHHFESTLDAIAMARDTHHKEKGRFVEIQVS